MRPSQEKLFADFEGDNYFERNYGTKENFNPLIDLPLKLIQLYDLKPSCVLEIGASIGARLAEIHKQYGSDVIAVEPSAKGIAYGRKLYPHIRFVQAVGCELPLAQPVDLIIVNFVFHWMDRENILRSIAEIDRLLYDKGYLIIGDFCPSKPLMVRYHHIRNHEVYTFKQNYASMLVAAGLYRIVASLSGDHQTLSISNQIDEDQRTGTWLLQKDLYGSYVKRSHSV